MKKFVAALLVLTVVFSLPFSAAAWVAEDIANDGGNEIIVPLQKPTINIGRAFSSDSGTPDHNGNTGGVYKGLVNVSRSGAQTVMAELDNYVFNAGKYKLSVWFMEDINNADKMTRMLRPEVSGATVCKDHGSYKQYLFYSGNQAEITLGEWKYAELEFEVSETNENKMCLGKKKVELKWECPTTWDSYASKNTEGDFYIYFSDIRLFKYPTESLSLENTNSGAEQAADESRFEAEFSAPINAETLESITVNNFLMSPEAFNITTVDNKLIFGPFMGFPPGKTYNLTLRGLSDIFERAYEGEISGTVTTKEYITAEYRGIENSKAGFEITNNMSQNVTLRVAVFFYNGNRIEKTFYSEDITAQAGETVFAEVDVEGGPQNALKKAQIYNAAQFLPMPLSAEIEL